MKEVIQHGAYYNRTAYCSCGCIFTYDEEDVIKDLSNASIATNVSTLRYVICPECGARVYIPTIVTVPGYTPPQPSIPQTPQQPYWPTYWPNDPWWNKVMCGGSTSTAKAHQDPNVEITLQGAKNE